MEFIEAYKQLEKLCGEIMNDEHRVTAYIDEMQKDTQGTYLVEGWDEDLKKLKYYRWLRNQIVHNPECTEENMCQPTDTQWIITFRTRIMNQTDPLAICRKARESDSKNKRVKLYQKQLVTGCNCRGKESAKIDWKLVCLLVLGIGIGIIMFMVLILLLISFLFKM